MITLPPKVFMPPLINFSKRTLLAMLPLRSFLFTALWNIALAKYNKSLHPIWSVGPAFASCSCGSANADPPAQTGELNRYLYPIAHSTPMPLQTVRYSGVLQWHSVLNYEISSVDSLQNQLLSYELE